VLKELSKMEQRYDAVLAVIRDGLAASEVATKLGVSRQSLYRWMARYEAGGLEALADRSHRPRTVPHQMPAMVEARVLELRRQRPHWGPINLRHQLIREGVDPVPSHMGIYRALLRHHLIEPGAKRKRLPTYKRWERGQPNELWQMDVVGGVLLADGTEAKVLTGIDDHSRFCTCAGLMVRATTRPVCGLLVAAFERHGVPEEILTDNAKVFTNRFAVKPTEVLFDKICRENGIVHRLTAPASPTTTGKVERFHRSLRVEFLSGKLFSSLIDAQAELDAWVAHYNADRPHQSLKMATPAERFGRRVQSPKPALDRSALDQDRSGDDWVSRTVSASGTVSVSNQVFSVGKHRHGATIDVRVTEKILEAWDRMDLLKSVLRTSKGVVRKKRAETHHLR
jgi:transposase InsO family protein